MSYVVKTSVRTFRKGDHIAWNKDHVRAGRRTGRVGSQHGTRIYAWPDDKNRGAERDGGCSEVDVDDVAGFVVAGPDEATSRCGHGCCRVRR